MTNSQASTIAPATGEHAVLRADLAAVTLSAPAPGEVHLAPVPSRTTAVSAKCGMLCMKAVWQGTVIAESDDIVQLDGNYYFPPASLKQAYFHDSETTSYCAWKGQARYYNVSVGDQINFDAAWCYPKPHQMAQAIEGRVAFWKDIQVLD